MITDAFPINSMSFAHSQSVDGVISARLDRISEIDMGFLYNIPDLIGILDVKFGNFSAFNTEKCVSVELSFGLVDGSGSSSRSITNYLRPLNPVGLSFYAT